MFLTALLLAVCHQVRAFLEGLPANAVVADVGCGNGKYFGVRRDLAVLGSDRSKGERGG
jgi:alkylated DNA repair protein alkB family protein 8